MSHDNLLITERPASAQRGQLGRADELRGLGLGGVSRNEVLLERLRNGLAMRVELRRRPGLY